MKIIFIMLLFSFAEINANNTCNINVNFVEPQQKFFIYKKLLPYSATIDDLRKFIASDNNCSENDITFLKVTDYKKYGKYEVCIHGKSMSYNRLNLNFIKNTNNLIDKSQLTNCTSLYKFKTYNINDKILLFFEISMSLILYITLFTFLCLL